MDTTRDEILLLLEQVPDPEVPALSVIDLGIVRDVQAEGQSVKITITPTYNGCPALDLISEQIKILLQQHGFTVVTLHTVLSPAWTTDWISPAGKEKLKAYGIAPPQPTHTVCDIDLFAAAAAIQCPRCQSWRTRLLSQFGSTACKALYQCNDCSEPFEYFKCH